MSTAGALLIDAGNTRVKWGVLSKGRVSRTGVVSHEKLQDTGYSAFTRRIPRQVSEVIVSNVAGSVFAKKLSSVIGIHCSTDLHFAHCERSAYGVTTAYKQPRRLGIDRWVAMIGARSEFSTALCVVDVGTAITIDVLDKAGRHLGGQIIPGLQLMGSSLQSQASGIQPAGKSKRGPGVGLELFGKTTAESIANGALSAVCGAIEFSVKRMRSEGMRPKIVLTGGDASRILKQLPGAILRPQLVLQGLSKMVTSDT